MDTIPQRIYQIIIVTYSRQDIGCAVGGVGKFDLRKADRDWGLGGSAELAAYGFTHGIDNEGKGDAISSYV